MRFSQKIMAIYDMAYESSKWADAIDAVQYGTGAKHMLLYDTGNNRAIKYSRQACDTLLSANGEALADYNALIQDLGHDSLDVQGSIGIHASRPFTPILDSDLWPITAAHERRPEIRFTVDRLGVYRRFYVNLSEDPSSFCALIALYPDGDRSKPLPTEDRISVSDLAPHLGKAMEIHRTLFSLRERYKAVLTMLDMILVPICLVDKSGRVLLKNHSADDLFRARDGVWIDRTGRIECEDHQTRAALREAIQATSLTAVGEADDRSRGVEIARKGLAPPFYAVASPLRDAGAELEPGLTGTFLTILGGPYANQLNIEIVANAFRLTRAEKKVASLLALGHSNTDIAQQLEVGSETIKSQVASILQKTGSRNRLGFLWRAFQFSPPLG